MVNSLSHPMALPRKSQKGVKDRYDFLGPIPGGVPIPDQTFLSFLTLPRSKIKDEIKSGQKIWLPRLAKRRYISVRSARGLEANIFEQEWGIRVIEGPSYLFFYLYRGTIRHFQPSGWVHSGMEVRGPL
jgi:hypothetical protein